MTHISLARTDSDIERAHVVMTQLRPHVPAEGFVTRVRKMEQEGFQLVYLEHEGEITAVAGFRVMDQLVSGRVLYVDDLVTDAGARSLGHGAALLDWLRDYAGNAGCTHLELDSGVHRAGAHRFYFRHGLSILGYIISGASRCSPPEPGTESNPGSWILVILHSQQAPCFPPATVQCFTPHPS